MRKRIGIIGGGVVGLTCAAVLGDNHDVTVIADKFGVESDSVKATAVWHVYLVPETDQVLDWSKQTLQKLLQLAQSVPASGVELVRGVELFRQGRVHRPSWAGIPPEFRMLSEAEVSTYNDVRAAELDAESIEMLRRKPVVWGYSLHAPAANMRKYLSWLELLVREKGVNFQRCKLHDLELVRGDFDVVVNCSGYGAKELVNDASFVPYKGQYFILRRSDGAPSDYVGDDDHPGGMAYFIPISEEVMIGGCAEEGKDDLVLTLTLSDVVKRAGMYVPWLRTQTVTDQSRPPVVGIRPARAGGVRLELEHDKKGGLVIHNYGHGGSGFSLAWGCAESVRALVENS